MNGFRQTLNVRFKHHIFSVFRLFEVKNIEILVFANVVYKNKTQDQLTEGERHFAEFTSQFFPVVGVDSFQLLRYPF